MEEFVLLLMNLLILVFVLTSMFGTGLGLTVSQILDPLRDLRTVVLALVANFILVPALAVGIAAVLDLEEGFRIGLIVVASAAGAPFLPKLAQVAKGNLAFSVGLMVLLMVVTVIYAPIVLPILIPGVAVNPWDIARPLITLMLIPLAIGLFVRSWHPDTATSLAPTMASTSSYSMMTAAVLGLLVGFQSLMAAFDTGAYLAAVLIVAGAIVIGYLLGTGGQEDKSVVALGTGQRNISAALLIASTNFTDPTVTLMVLVASVVGLGLLFLAAGTFGKRAESAAVN